MPDVNLMKDTEGLQPAAKKPVITGGPELTDPSANTGSGLFGKFKSFLNRGPKPLPTMPPAAAPSNMGTMTLKRSTGGGNDRILSETKKPASSVIPLPEDDGSSFHVNLLSEDLSPSIEPRRRAIQLGFIGLGALVLVGLVYGGLQFYKRSIVQKITDTESQLTAVKAEVSRLTADQSSASSTVQKLAAVGSLIERHTRWTKFFSLLERYTLPTVTYGPSFTGDLNGVLALTATADTYEQVAQQYLIFQQLVEKKTLISSFTITSASVNEKKDNKTTVSFVVGMTVLPDVFTMTADEAAKAAGQITGTTAQSLSVTTPSAATILAVLSEGPPSTGYTVVNGTQTMMKAWSDLEGVFCHLIATPQDIQSLPTFAQTPFQSAIQTHQAPQFCVNASTEMLSAGVTALKTDADQDGIDLLFEQLYATSDASASTTLGLKDSDVIQSQFLATPTTPTS